jgi:hypothetical protein
MVVALWPQRLVDWMYFDFFCPDPENKPDLIGTVAGISCQEDDSTTLYAIILDSPVTLHSVFYKRYGNLPWQALAVPRTALTKIKNEM